MSECDLAWGRRSWSSYRWTAPWSSSRATENTTTRRAKSSPWTLHSHVQNYSSLEAYLSCRSGGPYLSNNQILGFTLIMFKLGLGKKYIQFSYHVDPPEDLSRYKFHGYKVNSLICSIWPGPERFGQFSWVWNYFGFHIRQRNAEDTKVPKGQRSLMQDR